METRAGRWNCLGLSHHRTERTQALFNRPPPLGRCLGGPGCRPCDRPAARPGRLSEQAGQDHRRLPARWPDRLLRPHVRRAADDTARWHRAGREQAGCRRHPGHRCSGQVATRWPHAADDDLGHRVAEPRALFEAAVQPGQGPAADRLLPLGAADHRGRRKSAGKDAEGVHRVGAPEPLLDGHLRAGFGAAHGGRPVEPQRGHEDAGGSLPGREPDVGGPRFGPDPDRGGQLPVVPAAGCRTTRMRCSTPSSCMFRCPR